MDNQFFTTTNALYYLLETHGIKLAVSTLHKAEREGKIIALKTTNNLRLFTQAELNRFAKEKLLQFEHKNETGLPKAIAA